MLILQSIALGIVQGLTEFIPVSSSAHLVILHWLFGWNDSAFRSLGFDVALHMGTLIAILAFFRKDWGRIVSAWFRSVAERKIGKDPDRRMAWYLVAATIPGAGAGALVESRIERLFHPEGSPILASSMLAMATIIAVLGALLLLADSRSRPERGLGTMRWKDAILVGLSQALAVFPGVSRSGATITAGLALGLERAAAARFSFLLSAPIIAGAGAKSLYDLLKAAPAGAEGAGAPAILVAAGFIAAAASGFLCIKLLLGFLQRHTTKAFVFYRWGLALLVAAVAIFRG
jgi:undecaprenyl-diphosphatase